jgi:integrase
MPRKKSPPRLYFDASRQQWVVRDGQSFVRTGCGAEQRGEAERALAAYLAGKHAPEPSNDPLIADVLNLYAVEAAPHLKTAKNVAYNIGSVLQWWGAKRASEVTTKNCRAYASSKTQPAARSDLNVLKWAMKYWHQSEHGPLRVMPSYWLPPQNPPRERWLTRSEAARLLWAARPYPHIRRFILLGLYTGSRSSVLMNLRWRQIDLATKVMSRVPAGTIPDRRKRAPKGEARQAHPRAPQALEAAGWLA